MLEKNSDGGLKEKQRVSLLPAGARKSLSSILCPDWTKGRLFVGVRGANLIRELVVEQNGMIREGRILQTLGWPRSFLYLKQLDCLLIADEEFAESTGRLELFQILFCLFFIVKVLLQQAGKSYDCIHRCPHIMGHM